MIDQAFLTEFKRVTEAGWRAKSIDPKLYGFQFQPGTRWNKGLSTGQIREYEATLGIEFCHDLTTFLAEMNGTDIATLNVYGGCGEPHRESVGVYSYPRDLEAARDYLELARVHREEITADLAQQGFVLPPETGLVPFYSHRYVMCAANKEDSVVLSIVVKDVDAIVYAKSLEEYLEMEFLR